MSLHPDNDAVDCVDVDAWLTLQLVGGEPDARDPAIRAHILECPECRVFTQDIEGPGTADALFDLGAIPATDFTDLHVVATDNYARGTEIGRGGMGRIVRARDRRLGRSVAIKELLDDKMRARFEREARLTARLQHPAIVNVHEAGRWPSGAPFYVMKYVAGEPLSERIARTTTLEERLALLPNIITVVEALAYAHAERIIHRDIKPANILVGPFGETVVIDWGLAKDLGDSVADAANDAPYRRAGDEPLTVGGIGTPQYMPPEQAIGQMGDPRLDVYALGATLYHTLSGRLPYGDATVDRVLERLRDEAPAPLTEVAPGVPQELAAIVAKAMARQPDDRYATAGELADELKRFQTGQLVRAHSYSTGDLWRRWLRKHRVPVALATVFVVLLGGVGAASISRVYAARHTAEVQLAALLIERGERELSERQPSRALVYLDEALKLGVDTAALRYLVGEARRPADALVNSFRLDGGVRTVEVSPAGDKIAVSYSRQPKGVRPPEIWDVQTGTRLLTLGAATARTDILTFSPDGKLLVTAADTARLWDARSGALLATLGATPCFDATFTSDGAHVITVRRTPDTTDRATFASWDRAGQPLRSLDVPVYADHYFAVSDDGKRVLAIGQDYRGQIWDLDRGALVATLDEMPTAGGNPTVTFDPSGRRLYVGWQTEARIFDASTGHTLERFPRDLDVIRSAHLDDDGALLMVSLRHGAQLWPVDSTGKRLDAVSLQRSGPPVDQAIRIAGGELVTASAIGGIRFWGPQGEPRETTFDLNTAFVGAIRAAGDRLVTVGGDGTVTTWSLRPAAVPVASNRAQSVSFDGLGRVLIADLDGLSVWRLADGARLATTTQSSAALASFTADGHAVIGASIDGRVTRWDLDTNTVTETCPRDEDTYPGHMFTPAAATADGQRIVESGRTPEEDRSRIIAPDGKVIAAIRASHPTLAPRGDIVAALLPSRTAIGLWDVRSGAEVREFPLDAPDEIAADEAAGYHPGTGQILISPSGDRLITPLDREKNLIAVWDARGRRVAVFEVGYTMALRLSPDGKLLLVTHADALMVWRVETGALVSTLRLPQDAYFHEASFSADGKLIISHTGALELNVWETQTGELLESRTMPASPSALAVAPDGEHLVVDWRGDRTDSAIVPLHQSAIDRPALSAIVAGLPYSLEAGRLVPR